MILYVLLCRACLNFGDCRYLQQDPELTMCIQRSVLQLLYKQHHVLVFPTHWFTSFPCTSVWCAYVSWQLEIYMHHVCHARGIEDHKSSSLTDWQLPEYDCAYDTLP